MLETDPRHKIKIMLYKTSVKTKSNVYHSKRLIIPIRLRLVLTIIYEKGKIVKKHRRHKVCEQSHSYSIYRSITQLISNRSRPLDIATWLILPVAYACLKD